MNKLILSALLALFCTFSYGAKPKYSFFCELPGKEFSELFSDSILIKQLVKMQAAVRIGLHDFSEERTKTIQKLNQAGIPVVAWLLLPEEEGYWFNMNNGAKAEKRYADFQVWTKANHLNWKGIGIDLELDINDAKLAVKHPWKLAWKAYKRLYNSEQLKEGKEIYRNLINKMMADGYAVESYVIPFVFIEREEGTQSLQKLMGIVDLETDTEIPMVYTSAMNNSGIISVFHQKDMPIALGSTGGGVKIEGVELKALDWNQLKRDILISSKLTNEIHIFCLETSIKNNYLEKIESIDFSEPTPDVQQDIQKQLKYNRYIAFLLVSLNHPFWLTAIFVAIMAVAMWGAWLFLKLILKWLTLR